MGFFSRLFGKKQNKEGLPENVRDAFDRLTAILNDDEKQNAFMPKDFQKNFLRYGKIDVSIANDKNFGRSLYAPIPVNGPIGEITYLSNLQTKNGSRFFFHRLGSIKNEQQNIDIYEIVSWDGLIWDILYFDYYHNKKINATPNGYVFSGKVEGITGVNKYINNFPNDIYEISQQLAQNIFGVPCANPFMRHVDTKKIKRSPEFVVKIESILESVSRQSGVINTQNADTPSPRESNITPLHDIQLDDCSQEFVSCWTMAGKHIENSAQGKLFWLKAHLHPPFLEHLSFRLGNQLFFVRIEDIDTNLKTPGSLDGLMRVATGCNGYPCILPMKKRGNNWIPTEDGWGLIHAVSRKQIDPVMLISGENIEMTEWELYDFAVQIVRNNLHGHQIMSWSSDPEITPSIWFIGEHGPEWVLVKAVKYPETDAKLPNDIAKLYHKCSKIATKGHFAVVGIASSDQQHSNADAMLPLFRGHGLVARYEGLRSIPCEKNTTSAEKEIHGKNILNMTIEDTIIDLIKQDTESIEKGEFPERRLIPHHAIKRDILILGFEKDFSMLSKSMQKLNKADFDNHIYAIKQLTPDQLNEQLMIRMNSHKDIEELEDVIRAKSPIYRIVKKICSNDKLCLDTLNSDKSSTELNDLDININALNIKFINAFNELDRKFEELKSEGKNINTFDYDEFSIFTTYCLLSFLKDFIGSKSLLHISNIYNNPLVYFEFYCYIDAMINKYLVELSEKYEYIDGFDDATIDAAHLLDPFYELLDNVFENRELRNLHLCRYDLYFSVYKNDEKMALMLLSKLIYNSKNYELNDIGKIESNLNDEEKIIYNSLTLIRMTMGIFYSPIDAFLKSEIPSLKNKDKL
jgi:hypothetical protein